MALGDFQSTFKASGVYKTIRKKSLLHLFLHGTIVVILLVMMYCFWHSTTWVLFLLMALLFVASYMLWSFRVLIGAIYPSFHPDIKQLLNRREGREQVLALLEKELQDAPICKARNRFDSIWITEHFVFISSFYKFQWIYLEDLCWAHVYELKRTAYYVCTISKSFSIKFYLQSGREMSCAVLSKKASEEIINCLAEEAPFAIYGYSAELEELWKKDRKGMIREVRERLVAFRER